jgi:hypothetical protein
MSIKPISAPTPEVIPLTKVKFSFRKLEDRTVVGLKKDIESIKDVKITKDVSLPKELDLFEDELPLEPKTQTKKQSSFDKKKLCIYIFECTIGLILTVFSASNLYNTVLKSLGPRVEFLYVYQIGTILIVFGMLLVYDGIKRTATL